MESSRQRKEKKGEVRTLRSRSKKIPILSSLKYLNGAHGLGLPWENDRGLLYSTGLGHSASGVKMKTHIAEQVMALLPIEHVPAQSGHSASGFCWGYILTLSLDWEIMIFADLFTVRGNLP